MHETLSRDRWCREQNSNRVASEVNSYGKSGSSSYFLGDANRIYMCLYFII